MSHAWKGTWRSVLIAIVATVIFSLLAYAAWTQANELARTAARGTILTDLRFLVGFAAVFVVLGLANRIVIWVSARMGGE